MGNGGKSDGVSANFQNLSAALAFPRVSPAARNRIGEYNNGLRSTLSFAM